MKRSLIAGVLVAFVGAVFLSGCATGPSGPSDEELIKEAASGMTAAMVAQDLDKLMTFFSEDFENWEWGDKAGFKDFIGEAIDMGYLESAEVDMEDAEYKIEDGTGTVSPIELTASFGSATLEATLKKEGTAWLIVGMDVEMY